MEIMVLQLNVLTLNVWGIPFVSSDREARMIAIGNELNSGRYDIVSMQEVWSQSDYEALKIKTAAVLPYSHYFHSGVMGAGLLVLSKHPIIGSFFHAWSVNGYFHRIQHADWYGGKGVGMCRIQVGEHVIHLYNAHLHAEYNNENDEYKTHRVIQAFDTAQFIKATRGNSVMQILAGDLNTKAEDLPYKMLLYASKMRDCCTLEATSTHECQRNSYTPKKLLENNAAGIRIDHIFMRKADHISADIVEYVLPFPERVPGQKYSFSDHEAVMVRFKLSMLLAQNIKTQESENIPTTAAAAAYSTQAAIATTQQQCAAPLTQHIETLTESIALCDSSLQQLKIDRVLYYSIAIFFFFLLIALAEFAMPSGFKTLMLLLKLFVFVIVLFSLFMASIWNYIEENGVLSGKKAMELMLKCVREKSATDLC